MALAWLWRRPARRVAAMVALFRAPRPHALLTDNTADRPLAGIDEAALREPGERIASVMLPSPLEGAAPPSIEALLARLARHDRQPPLPHRRAAG